MLVIKKDAIIQNPGRDFTFEYGAGTATVRLRPVSRLKQLEIEQAHTRTKTVKGRPIKETDEEAVADDRLDYCIVSWSGIMAEGPEGPVPLECSRENKLWLMNNFPPFAAFVNTNLVSLLNGETTMLEEEEKNSGSSPGGTS